MNQYNAIAVGVLLLAVSMPLYPAYAATVTVDYTNQINEKQQEIDALNKKIADLANKRSKTADEAQGIAIALEQLKADLQRANVQLAKTQTTISDVKAKSKDATAKVGDLQSTIDKKKQELDSLVRQLYEFEQVSLVQVFFDSQSLSDVFSQRDAYRLLQQRAVGVLTDMHAQEDELTQQKNALDQQADDLGQLQRMQNVQAQDLVEKKSAQKQFLQETEQQKARYDILIAESQRIRDEIKRQVFTLQNGTIKVSLSTANDMAKFAGKVTGVRPALIMAVLQIESGVGVGLGSGLFPASMSYSGDREAFLRITKKLGIDPYKAPLSSGGAMGPAQIKPTTWEGMEPQIENLMNKELVNPYELSDAFVAAGIFLLNKGAQNPANEADALQRYVCGDRGAKIYDCSWYSDKVLFAAKKYEDQGL